LVSRQPSRVELCAAIRRDARAGMSGRELQRVHGVGWRTVQAALASAWPAQRAPYPARASRLDPFKPLIDQILVEDLDAPRKQRHTITRIFDRLCSEHGMTDISYPVVRAYVARRRPEIRTKHGRTDASAFIPQSHLPGREAEVDFGEISFRLRGELVTCHPFSLRMSYSGKAVHRVSATGGQEAFFEGHVQAFQVLGGVPAGRIRYDNLKPPSPKSSGSPASASRPIVGSRFVHTSALDKRGAELLFQVLTEREEKASVAIASNEAFSWLDQDLHRPRLSAIVDRLTFGGNIIETGTDSYPLAHTLRARKQPDAGRQWLSRLMVSEEEQSSWRSRHSAGTALSTPVVRCLLPWWARQHKAAVVGDDQAAVVVDHLVESSQDLLAVQRRTHEGHCLPAMSSTAAGIARRNVSTAVSALLAMRHREQRHGSNPRPGRSYGSGYGYLAASGKGI
jgi:transposase